MGRRLACSPAQRVAGGMTVSGTELQEYVAGLDYPVSREDLVRWGQENGASTDVLQMLHALPAEEFASPTELSDALGSLA